VEIWVKNLKCLREFLRNTLDLLRMQTIFEILEDRRLPHKLVKMFRQHREHGETQIPPHKRIYLQL
jgi:CBS-domain-containing membrane protein